jgi:glycosyltransferase involved in cell wall biosynthesis
MKKLAYLCLQATREGQASHAHVHEIIKGLRKREWTVDLYEPAYARASEAPHPLLRALELLWVQLKLWLSGRPPLLYIRGHFASWPTALWARLLHIPVVQEVNGPDEELFVSWPWTRRFARLFKWLIRSQLRWSDSVIAVTRQLTDWCRTQGAKKVYVIPNGANTELFNPEAQPDPALQLPPKYVIFFGALARWQGIDTMLAAVRHPSWPQEVRLVIVGDGAERAKVEAAALSSPLVLYLGPQPYARVPGIVAHSLAALSPQGLSTFAQSESLDLKFQAGLLPLKLFESLACGVPVVVTDYPGMSDLVRENQCGVVIPPNDPVALAQAVAYLYAHPEERLRMGLKGRAIVEESHSWDRRSEDTMTVLDELLESIRRRE